MVGPSVYRPLEFIDFVSTLVVSIFIIFCSFSSSVSLTYLIRAVPMRKCCGQHCCKSSTFYIAILNGTCSLRSAISAKDSGSGVLLNYTTTNTTTNTITITTTVKMLHS